MDLEQLKSLEILEVFVLCTSGELNKYRVPTLLEKYEQHGILFHHYPFPDGTPPEINCLMKLIAELICSLNRGHRVLIHCFGGLGRSCAGKC
ncbi:cyclin-dependent kinase inhibitor 3-like [Limulus polyphemus]|uniref:protein-tyrosine-phosphatase n=1 Tax=Limulus polyphemus TaxID=6850 RepID=A0ABM1BXU4_LIMPO|nr:cyclin-dependent kinase inhibitor 3-like [Limulus polyphemus]